MNNMNPSGPLGISIVKPININKIPPNMAIAGAFLAINCLCIESGTVFSPFIRLNPHSSQRLIRFLLLENV